MSIALACIPHVRHTLCWGPHYLLRPPVCACSVHEAHTLLLSALQAPDQSRYIAKGPQPMLGNEMPSREDFQLANATCILWDPESMWPDANLRRCMKCPSCKSSKRVQADGHSDVRRVISRTGSAFVMTRKYRCKGCPGEITLCMHFGTSTMGVCLLFACEQWNHGC